MTDFRKSVFLKDMAKKLSTSFVSLSTSISSSVSSVSINLELLIYISIVFVIDVRYWLAAFIASQREPKCVLRTAVAGFNESLIRIS